jgi:chemotaxis protein MotA
MGLIGTLIGLVQMLGSLEDTSTIGPAMAVALLTTFYGAILSYMIFTPLASKLERNTKQEMIVARIYVQSILSMLKKENPRKLEMMINGILPPNKRIRYFKNYTEENKDQASS